MGKPRTDCEARVLRKGDYRLRRGRGFYRDYVAGQCTRKAVEDGLCRQHFESQRRMGRIVGGTGTSKMKSKPDTELPTRPCVDCSEPCVKNKDGDWVCDNRKCFVYGT